MAKLLGDSLERVEQTYAYLSPDLEQLAVARSAGAVRLSIVAESSSTRPAQTATESDTGEDSR